MGGKKAGPRVSRKARSDLAELAAYYGGESLDLELVFISAVERMFDTIAASPQIGAKREYIHPLLNSLRFWRVPQFPNILVFYREQDGVIEIVRLLHSSRDLDSLLHANGEE